MPEIAHELKLQLTASRTVHLKDKRLIGYRLVPCIITKKEKIVVFVCIRPM